MVLTDTEPEQEQREAPVVLYVIWCKPPGSRKWARAGRTSTRAEALTLIGGPGEWKVTEERAEE